jgi:uncharacterized membrane protein YcaP (DUF421 family)
VNEILPYLYISAKSIAVYLFIILAIRIFGKKELAQLSVIDVVFILLISNSVQNAMVGSNSTLAGGLSAAFSLFLANFIFKLLLRKYTGFSKFIQGEKIILIHDGVVLSEGLKKAMMTKSELDQTLREHDIMSIENVSLAVLEVDGNISFLTDNYSKKSNKKRLKTFRL